MNKINFKKKLELFDQYWVPKIVGEVNDQYVKVAKAKGSMDWQQLLVAEARCPCRNADTPPLPPRSPQGIPDAHRNFGRNIYIRRVLTSESN